MITNVSNKVKLMCAFDLTKRKKKNLLAKSPILKKFRPSRFSKYMYTCELKLKFVSLKRKKKKKNVVVWTME